MIINGIEIGKYWGIKNIKLIIGSGGLVQKGFIDTDIDFLDIRNPWAWRRNFFKNSINTVFAEHVFEHLNSTEVNLSLRNIFKYLSIGGRLRIAVPDKNRKDLIYVKEVAPPKDGHKSYFNINSLTKVLTKIGFKVIPLEYFDKNQKFIHNKWDVEDGKILRSFKFDRQKKFKRDNYHYTSLVVDAIKP